MQSTSAVPRSLRGVARDLPAQLPPAAAYCALAVGRLTRLVAMVGVLALVLTALLAGAAAHATQLPATASATLCPQGGLNGGARRWAGPVAPANQPIRFPHADGTGRGTAGSARQVLDQFHGGTAGELPFARFISTSDARLKPVPVPLAHVRELAGVAVTC